MRLCSRGLCDATGHSSHRCAVLTQGRNVADFALDAVKSHMAMPVGAARGSTAAAVHVETKHGQRASLLFAREQPIHPLSHFSVPGATETPADVFRRSPEFKAIQADISAGIVPAGERSFCFELLLSALIIALDHALRVVLTDCAASADRAGRFTQFASDTASSFGAQVSQLCWRFLLATLRDRVGT